MEFVDWDLAAATGRRLVRPGPELTRAEADAAVAQMRELAPEALGHVAAYTGLVADPLLRTSNAVVDRGSWIDGNVAGMRVTLAPLLEGLAAKRMGKGAGAEAVTAVGRRVTGVEIGGILAFLASRVLGQYEVFLPPEEGDGRLSLVAPNIVEVERRLGVDPRDFRMWVCLHEQTHHLQFTGVPWLKGQLTALVETLAESADLDPRALIGRLRSGIRARADGPLPGGPLALLQTPEQRAATARAQSLMTLLEGHADWVMDAVGPQVVPSVASIRELFEQRRRRSGSPVERLLRSLLGMDAKLAQYRTGGAFCRTVAAEAGPKTVGRAFESPAAAPSAEELAEPARWLERIGA